MFFIYEPMRTYAQILHTKIEDKIVFLLLSLVSEMRSNVFESLCSLLVFDVTESKSSKFELENPMF